MPLAVQLISLRLRCAIVALKGKPGCKIDHDVTTGFFDQHMPKLEHYILQVQF